MREKLTIVLVIGIIILAAGVYIFDINLQKERLSPSSSEWSLCTQISWGCPSNNQFINDCFNPPLPNWEWCQGNGYGCTDYWQSPTTCLADAYDQFRQCLYGNPGLGCPSYDPSYCQCKADCAQNYKGNQRGCECHRLQTENCGKKIQTEN